MSEFESEAIVIEGFGGAGKTTTAQLLAVQEGYSNFNTGTLFRAAATAAIQQSIPNHELAAFVAEARFDIDISDPLKPLLAVDGRDVSDVLQLPSATKLASALGRLHTVADRLETIFDNSLQGSRLVIEGKNLGERVEHLPHQRFFLVASQGVRAYRKWQQAVKKGETSYSLRQAQCDIVLNDLRDRNLLTINTRTKIIDTTNRTPQQVVRTIVDCIAACERSIHV